MFLVVLMPIARSAHPVPRVRLLELGKRVGREIVGLKRTTRCWFEPGYIEAEVEVSTGAEVYRYLVIGAGSISDRQDKLAQPRAQSVRQRFLKSPSTRKPRRLRATRDTGLISLQSPRRRARHRRCTPCRWACCRSTPATRLSTEP